LAESKSLDLLESNLKIWTPIHGLIFAPSPSRLFATSPICLRRHSHYNIPMPETIKWHTIFAAVLRELLTPLQIQVLDEFPLTGEADILLIQLLEGQLHWTEEQRQVLPDGLRNSPAREVLVEFKYSQSLNEASFRQALAYDTLYRQQQDKQKLPATAIQTFMVSAKTPQAETLKLLGYEATAHSGVYVSQTLFLRDIGLILLNELSDEPHNAFFKLFASRRQAKLAAVRSVQGLGQLRDKLFWLIKGLLDLWFKTGGISMEAITVDTLIEDGKHIMEWLGPFLTEEEVLNSPIGQQIYHHIRAEEHEKAQEETRQEILALLLRTLKRLFRKVPPKKLVVRLEKLTLPQLRQAIDLAFDAPNLTEFQRQLNQAEQSSPSL